VLTIKKSNRQLDKN